MSASASIHRRALPPFWLPLLAGLPLAACLLLMAVPNLGHGGVSVARTQFLLAFVLWVLPLTAVQRALWRRGTRSVPMVLILLATTGAMAIATRALHVAWQVVAAQRLPPPDFDWLVLLRGLEGAWLGLVAYCAIHAVVAYYAELRQEQADHLQARALARDAQLRALRYQLQPHFLFNTLNAISALVASGEGPRARQMLARLGDFLRATLDGGHGHEVAVAEEIAITDAYLEIEQARLGERLQLSWHLGPGVLAARVPYLVLQPLVENAIRHGIAPRRTPGRLDIRIAGDGGRLRVRISNDLPSGEDARPDTAVAIEADPARATVGLRNVRERLAALHADAAAMHAGIGDDARYHVELDLPLYPHEAAA